MTAAPYFSSPKKRIDMLLASLIGERVDIRLETVDYNTALISIAVTHSLSAREGHKGVAVALRHPELVKLRDALTTIITKDPGE